MLAETITEWTKQWKAEGKTEGKTEGRIEEKFKMIKRLHDFNMSIDEIAVIVNLPVDKIKKIFEAGEHGIELIQESDLLS